jgi:hypothetical protein
MNLIFFKQSLFVRLISHQPAVLFSQNKPATSNQPAVLFSQNKSAPDISHQPAVLFSQNKPATSNQPAVLFSQNKSAPAISHQPNEQAEYLLLFCGLHTYIHRRSTFLYWCLLNYS